VKAANSAGQLSRSSDGTASGFGSATMSPVAASVAIDPVNAEKAARTPIAAHPATKISRRHPRIRPSGNSRTTKEAPSVPGIQIHFAIQIAAPAQP
jgi:hypothetical protein